MKFVLLLSLLAIGCAPEISVRTPYNDATASRYQRTGTARITGNLFARTRGGEMKQGAGQRVYLYPAVPYVQELVARMSKYEEVRQDRFMMLHEKCDGKEWGYPRFDSTWNADVCIYVREVTTDITSAFTFPDLPAGDYYVESVLWWWAGNTKTGGTARAFVSVKEGEAVKINLCP